MTDESQKNCKHCSLPIHPYTGGKGWIHYNGEYDCLNRTTGVFHLAEPSE